MKSAARRTASARAGPLPQGQRPARGALAARDAGDRDPRHQARRGRASAARRAFGMPDEWRASGHVVEPALARAPGRRRAPRAARSQRRIHVLPDAGRLLADRHARRPEHAAPTKRYQARIEAALEKSLREAKRRSSWTAPNAEYEQAMRAFAREALSPEGNGFLTSFLPFVQRIARLGVENSLAQTVAEAHRAGRAGHLSGLRVVGSEPGRPRQSPRGRLPRGANRRWPGLAPRLAAVEGRRELFETLMKTGADGRVKLATIALLLAFRREQAEFFARADYQPLEIQGEDAHWAAGFVRSLRRPAPGRSDRALSQPCARPSRNGARRLACPRATGSTSSEAAASTPPGR